MSQAAEVQEGKVLDFVNATGAALNLGDLELAKGKAALLQDAGMGTTGPNTTLADGSKGRILIEGVIEAPKVAAGGAVVAGQPAYWDPANNRFTPLQSGGQVYRAGIFAEDATQAATRCKVKLEGSGGLQGLIYSNTADSTAVANTATETDFDTKATLDGSQLQVGDVIHILAQAHVIGQNATDTLTLKVYIGTELIVATAAVDVGTDDVGLIEAFAVVRAIGASGTLAAAGIQALGAEGTVTAKPFRKAQASEDLSGNVDVKASAKWSAANAANQVELEEFIVEVIRK